jgi:hypothetical protein
MFEQVDEEFRRMASKIWINQKIIEPCLAISKLTKQKVFHFNGDKLQDKFLDAEKGDFICTQAVAWQLDSQ